MDKQEYLILKKHVRSLCLDSVKDLAKKVGLSEYETSLLIHINKNDSRVCSAMHLGICESKVSKDARKIFLKIKDYLKRQV